MAAGAEYGFPCVLCGKRHDFLYGNDTGKAVAILKNIRLITFAESLGGTESLLTYPAVQTHPDVPEEQRKKLGITDTLLRLSVGIENPDDIIADLRQAFENAGK